MTPAGLIIVGSGPAGVSAAEAFRKHNSVDPVRILTDDPALPYARPPLSKEFLRGDVEVADAELHPAQWFDERAIELVARGGVDAIDLMDHSVTAAGKSYPYRWLVLACGAKPSPFSLPGSERAVQLRSLADAQVLREAAAQAESAVVIGAGFIGCEAAASLAIRGVSTTLVAPSPVPQAKRLGEEAGVRIKRLLGDAQMRTSAANVYAAGDVAIAFNRTAGRPVSVEHWQDAVDQGEIAGAGAANEKAEWDSVPGFWTTIGEATLKYHAWGDGFERARLVEHRDGFTVWYEDNGAAVGVLCCNADGDYDRGEDLIRHRSPIPR